MRRYLRWDLLAGIAAALTFASALVVRGDAVPEGPSKPPALLRDTGLYSKFESLEVDLKHLGFSPQYPLWTDGATKRRWISLPPGTAIDASDPEHWNFPAGTRIWKEFSFGGRPVETRFIERLADGQWRYVAYEWSADGREATLAPEQGQRGAYDLGDGRAHTIPGVTDCKVCHEASRTPVLGFSLLQLSPDRDPGAAHAESTTGVDLAYLAEAGLIVGLPAALLEAPPRIAAATETERAAVGYLHGNCGHCHNADGKLQNIGLSLRHVSGAAVEPAVASTVGTTIKKPAPGQSPEVVLRVAPGYPERSGLAERMGSRWAAMQMPPLGTVLLDADGLELVRAWIAGIEGVNKPGNGRTKRHGY